MLSRNLISIGFIVLTAALTASCGAGTALRTSQINPRQEAMQCVALRAIQPDQWQAAVANPNLGAIFDQYGIEPSAATQAIEQAAGDYARSVQAIEQNFTARRDLDQSSVNVEMCNRQRELWDQIQANNAGPSN